MGIQNDGYYTDETLFKVYKVMRNNGLEEQKAIDLVGALQNEGILFRERPPAKAVSAQPAYRGE